MTKIALKGMKFHGLHGVYEQERVEGNRFEIDVTVETRDFDGDDEIQDTYNYEKIYAACDKYMSLSFKLIETIAQKIAKEIKEDDQVRSVHIVISKLNPPLPGNVERSVCEYSI